MKTASPLVRSLLALAVMAVIAGCAASQTRESTGEYLDDSAITTKVKGAILNDPSLKVFEIKVATFRGVVQLSGFVKSPEIVAHAANVTSGVSGVTSVRNDLIVKQ
jgi:osmotically-inducible protein OsmY